MHKHRYAHQVYFTPLLQWRPNAENKRLQWLVSRHTDQTRDIGSDINVWCLKALVLKMLLAVARNSWAFFSGKESQVFCAYDWRLYEVHQENSSKNNPHYSSNTDWKWDKRQEFSLKRQVTLNTMLAQNRQLMPLDWCHWQIRVYLKKGTKTTVWLNLVLFRDTINVKHV